MGNLRSKYTDEEWYEEEAKIAAMKDMGIKVKKLRNNERREVKKPRTTRNRRNTD